MKYFLGIDTSNYTTSCAVTDENGRVVVNSKRLLPVAKGEKGLRQSDAVFNHIKALPEVVGAVGQREIACVGYSAYPRDTEGSYMPCFLVGKALAESAASLFGVDCFKFSHQRGHIRAALYSAGKEDLIGKEYLAFHVSGGTTELLHCKNHEIVPVGRSLDISAGQAIDRVGVMLGLDFPCGKYLEERALKAEKAPRVKICVRNGESNLSGIENLAAKMLKDGVAPEIIALYTLNFVKETVIKTVKDAFEKTGEIPVIFAGGVMSNRLIRKDIANCCEAYFSEPEFSSDNAAGVSLLAYDKYGR